NEPTPEGNDRTFPGVDGGANWMSHSYSPLTRLLYVFAREERRVFTKSAIRHGIDEDPTMAPGALGGADSAVAVTGGAGGRAGRAGRGGGGNGMFGAGGNLPGGGLGGR